MYFTCKRKHALLYLKLFLQLLALVSCKTAGSQPVTVSDPVPTNTRLHEEIEIPPISPAPPATFSLLTTWEMQTTEAIAWHPTNPVVAISGWDSRHIYGIRLYDAQTGAEWWSNEEGPNGGLAFTPDGNLLVTASAYEARVQMLATEDGHVVSTIGDANCSAGDLLHFNTTGDALLTGLGSGHIDWETTLNLWDVPRGRCQTLENRPGLLHFLDVNDDFSLVIMSTTGQNRQVYVWDLEKRIDVCQLPGRFGLFAPHTNQFVISNTEKLTFYDVSSCQIVKEFVIDPPLRGYIAFTPGGELFAVAGEYLQLWETDTGELLSQEKLPDEFFGSGNHPSFAFNHDGNYLLAAFQTPPTNDVGNTVIQVWQVITNP